MAYHDAYQNEGYLFDADLLQIRRMVEAFEASGETEYSPLIHMARQLLDHIDAIEPRSIAAQTLRNAAEDLYSYRGRITTMEGAVVWMRDRADEIAPH